MSDEIALQLIQELKENTAAIKNKAIDSGILTHSQAIEFMGWGKRKDGGRRDLSYLKRELKRLTDAGSSRLYYRDELIIVKHDIQTGAITLPKNYKKAA